jgi:hypothetical protein
MMFSKYAFVLRLLVLFTVGMPSTMLQSTLGRNAPETTPNAVCCHAHSSRPCLIKVKVWCESNQTESQLSTTSLLLSLQELPNPEIQCLVRQNIFI